MNTQIDRLGKVSITVEKDYWNITKCYDKLVIVEKENDCSYLSRKPVPSGVSIYNREYWIKLCSSHATNDVLIEATFNPNILDVGESTNIAINIQLSAPATSIVVKRDNVQVGTTGSGTQHTVIDTIVAQNTNDIFYEVTAIVNNTVVGKGFSIQVRIPSAPIMWNTAQYTYVMTDENPVLPPLRNDQHLSIEYESTNTNVIEVDRETAAITLIGAGFATIKAIFRGNNIYQETVSSLGVSVTKGNYLDLSWKRSNDIITSDSISLNQHYLQPVLYNPLNKNIDYYSSNTQVAQINENGVITIVGCGTCTITASFNGDNVYNSVIVTYLLTVFEQRYDAFVGAGPDFDSTNFVSLSRPISDNTVVNIPTNEEDYIFIKVGINDTIRNFKTYTSANSQFNYDIALEEPIVIDEHYKYYRTQIQFNLTDGVYIINEN